MKRRIFKFVSIIVLVVLLNAFFVISDNYIKGLDYKKLNIKFSYNALIENKTGFNDRRYVVEDLGSVVFESEEAYATEVPVLNYHFFYNPDVEGCNSVLCLSRYRFEEQIKYLVDNNYKILTLDEYIRWKNGEKKLPKKSVLITIDDGGIGTGYSNGNELIPILEKYQVHAVLFLITAWNDYNDYGSEYLLLQSHGHDIHRKDECNRNRIECISKGELKQDLIISMDILDSYDSFAYPFFDYTYESIEVLSEMGVKVAFVGGNRKSSIDDNNYLIPRYEILKYTTMDQFISYVE